jgi:hypothetical protein
LFPAGVYFALHGHVHLFEAIGFASDHSTAPFDLVWDIPQELASARFTAPWEGARKTARRCWQSHDGDRLRPPDAIEGN